MLKSWNLEVQKNWGVDVKMSPISEGTNIWWQKSIDEM